MNRIVRLSRKWIPLILKGIFTIPLYLKYWGFTLGVRRLTKFGLAHGIVRLRSELSAVVETKHDPQPQEADYIIYTPDYIGRSAGVRCLFRMAEDLKQLGFKTAVTGCLHCPPNYQVPRIPLPRAKKLARSGAWIIYPETVYGNPLKSKNVVRWVLNRPGFLGGELTYPTTEQVFIYSDVYRNYVTNNVSGKVCTPMLDVNLFYPPGINQDRSLKCYYVGKSRFSPDHFDSNQVFEITREAPAREELGKLFRASKVLYCFDNSTALIYEALLCGCPVIVIPDGSQTWADYQKLELGTAGISWGVPSKPPTAFDPQDLRERLLKLNSDYHDQVKCLVDHTQKLAATTTRSNSGWANVDQSIDRR